MARAEETAEQTPEQVLEPVLEQLRADDSSKALAELSLLGKFMQGSGQSEELLLKLKQFRQSCGKSQGEVEL